jgi:putative flippase GtrA
MGNPVMGRLAIFATIGCIGFGVEAIILTVATTKFGLPTLETRLISFPCAVLLTWWLNRKYNFRSQASVFWELWKYFGSQSIGALTNLAVFVGCWAAFPSLSTSPILLLGLGALAGLVVNFALLQWYVFGKKKGG